VVSITGQGDDLGDGVGAAVRAADVAERDAAVPLDPRPNCLE
jgi:hypothetical protein